MFCALKQVAKFNMTERKVFPLIAMLDPTEYCSLLKVYKREMGNKKYFNKETMAYLKRCDEAIYVFYKSTPGLYSGRITRSVSKMRNDRNFIVREDYRCMALLGDEEAVPNWDVHVAKYSIFFV